MPAPTSTDKYPLWLKQALNALITDPSRNLPKHVPFKSAEDLAQFKRLWYGYQKALTKEETEQFKATGESEWFSRTLGQLMLREIRKEEFRQYPEAFKEFVIMLRDSDPRTEDVQELFSEMIIANATAPTPSTPEEPTNDDASPSMDDVLKDTGYFGD